MRVLVTGGAGYIGSHACVELLNAGHEIVIVDNFVNSKPEALDAIRFYTDCVDNGHLPFVLAVELKETGELIGDTGISEVDGQPEETEIGYCVGEKYRRKGYASELLEAISGFVVSRFGIRKIYGRVVHGNGASARVLEKSGYRFVKEEFGAEDDPYGNGMLVYLKES